MLEEKEIRNWIDVGRKTKDIREKLIEFVEEGITYRELYDKILSLFKKKSLDLAFPINISKNEVAAHDTSDVNDNRVIEKGDVLKIDIGGMMSGFLSDTAITIEVGTENFRDVINLCEKIMNKIEDILKPKIMVCEIGRVVEEMCKKFSKVNPVFNLTGHNIKRYKLHGGISIPNYDNKSRKELINEVVAIEIFITTGRGYVREKGTPKIFSIESKRIRNFMLKKYIEEIWKDRKGLPFDVNYLKEKFGENNYKTVYSLLVKESSIRKYPPLVEVSNGIVFQLENTFIITEEDVIKTT